MSDQLEMWRGAFGEAYTDRNVIEPASRLPAFRQMLEGLPLERVLEVGCNRGHNLLALADLLPEESEIVGIEPNPHARALARAASTRIAVMSGQAAYLPFRENYFDMVFTSGVLIHIPPDALPTVLSELHRVSRRYLLAIEYFASEAEEISYRGHEGLLWKRNFLQDYQSLFPTLRLLRQGYWRAEDGFDRATWWLMEKSAG
ncbi:MAG: methyltransferase domain-containing protein [Ardenticatenales bacterium]|nr:methyltransferase domain-containing protein [Ardenticatenales bacterium]